MAEQETECAPVDWVCRAGEGLGDAASSIGQNVVEDFVRSLGEGTVNVLTWLNTFWLEMPTPDIAGQSVTRIQEYLSWYTFWFALAGILIALIRMAATHQFSSGAPAVKMIVNLIVVSAALTVTFEAALRAGDAFAPWIVEKVTGEAMSLDGFLTVDMLMATGTGPGLLLALLAFLGALANVAFMVLRGALVLILYAFLPTLAAASASESGAQAFRKAIGWMIAFVLFKPVAGVIYALGIVLLREPVSFASLDEAGNGLYMTAVAVVVVAAAALALPALVKFITPVAAAGTSGLFSGAGAGAAVVATGAAVVALGATGGAAAGAAPAASAAGAGAASGGTAASGTTGAATASSGAAASTPSTPGSLGPSGTGGGPGGSGGSGPGSSGGSSAGGGSGQGAPASGPSQGSSGAGAPSSGAQGRSGAAPGDGGSGQASPPSSQPGSGSSTSNSANGARAIGDLGFQVGLAAGGAMDDVTEGES